MKCMKSPCLFIEASHGLEPNYIYWHLLTFIICINPKGLEIIDYSKFIYYHLLSIEFVVGNSVE